MGLARRCSWGRLPKSCPSHPMGVGVRLVKYQKCVDLNLPPDARAIFWQMALAQSVAPHFCVPNLNPYHRRLFSWIAILAILLNALMPVVSQAVDSSRGKRVTGINAWIEVCSSQGTTWVRLASDGSLIEQTSHKPVDAPALSHGEHCLYCLTHAASFGLLPLLAWGLPVWSRTTELLPRSVLLPQIPVAWLAPAARAPPHASF